MTGDKLLGMSMTGERVTKVGSLDGKFMKQEEKKESDRDRDRDRERIVCDKD